MLRLDRVIKPWKEAAALTDYIKLYGFWNETTFLTKSGDLGMVLRVPGVDYESLDHAEQEYAVKRLESALKAFGPGFHVYQYLFKQNRPEIPFVHYDDAVVEAAIEQRRQFFESKRDHLYQIEIYYCIVLEGARSKTGVGAALARLFRDPAGAVGELRAQFTNNSMKTLLRSQIEHDRARLDQRVQAFHRQLADFVQLEVLDQEGQFCFFRRLLNYDDWRIAGKPQSTQFLDYQVVNSNVEGERDHLRVGDHVVRVLTMKEAITETRPLVLDALLKIPGNFYVVTEWTQLAGDKARKEVNKRRRHFNMSKTGFVSQMGNDASKTNPRDVLVDESKQADIENLGDCLRALGDGQSLGDFSLTIVLYGKSKAELDQLVGEFTGVFTNADGNLFAETYNQLNAYFATIPGTARPVDGYAAPQLHTHAVIFNMTERGNGQPRALQERALFLSQQFATAVYQSELTYRLSRLGYDLVPGRSGAPEIKGYTQEYLDASSPRSQQIREHMEKIGVESKTAAQIAAHATRDRKQIAGPEATLAAHQRLASEFGNQPQLVIAAAHERAQKPSHAEKKSPAQLAQESVNFARDRLYEREAVVDERRLYRDALRRGMGEVNYPEVRRAIESRLTQKEFLPVAHYPHASARQITTDRMIAMEKEIIGIMRAGQGTAEPIMSHFAASQVADRHPELNRSQQRAVEQVLTSADRIQAIQGYAGVGKSTALSAIREGAESAGYAVEGFAPTSRAAQQLRDVGVSATTLQGFLARGGQEQTAGDPASRHLYMLDESSLASTKQVRDFLQKIGSQDMVLLIGDIRQHQAVEAGKPFEQLQQAGMQTAQLDQIVRQKDPELLRVVEHLAKADVATGICLLQEQGRVTEIPDRTDRIQTIAKDYAANPERTLIVSPDNASRRDVNDAVHIELQRRSHIALQNHAVSVLVQRAEMTGADRSWASRYQVGDVLHYQRGSPDLGIQGGSYTQVVATDPKENSITVRKQNGEDVTYNPSRLRGIDAYSEVERNFSVGDRIQFTAPNRELHVANRALGTIEQIAQDSFMTVRMNSGKTVSFDPNGLRHFDHGYAVTSHSSQGLTADRVLVNVDQATHPDLINSRFAYVALSRGSLDARIYTNDIKIMAGPLATDLPKSSALDLGQSFSHPETVNGQGIQQSI